MSAATPICCSAMNTEIVTITALATAASVGTPSTAPADARISARTNSPSTRPSTMTMIAANTLGM